MIIFINDKPCEAKVGDKLLGVAQLHKSHIGYICGGNGFCQSCFVYVKEGAECLSAPSAAEKAFISDKLFNEGGRLACQSTIVKEGTIRLLSRAEYLRRLVFGLNIPGFVTYAQTIGYNVITKLPDGSANLVGRVRSGEVNAGDSLAKIGQGLAHASLFVVSSFMETFPFMRMPVALIGDGAKNVVGTASNLLCNVSGGRLHLPGTACSCSETQKTQLIEPVKILRG